MGRWLSALRTEWGQVLNYYFLIKLIIQDLTLPGYQSG